MGERRLDRDDAVTADELKALVATMRELGVTECGDVKLGPAPAPTSAPVSSEEKIRILKDRHLREEERQRDIMFAASHIKPALRSVK